MEKAIKKYWPVFLLPTMLAFTIGFIAPFIMGIYLSFCKFTTVTDAKFVGLANYVKICCSNAFDKEDQGNQYIPYRILYAKLDWRYYSGIYLAAFIKWYFAVFSEDTDIFFCIWILGIGNFDAVAAGRLYDDYLYFRNPKYTRRIN